MCSLIDLLENSATKYQSYIQDSIQQESPTKDIDEDTSWQMCHRNDNCEQNSKESEDKDNYSDVVLKNKDNDECYDSGDVEESLIVPSFKHYLKDDYNKLSGNLYDCIDILYTMITQEIQKQEGAFSVCWRCLN